MTNTITFKAILEDWCTTCGFNVLNEWERKKVSAFIGDNKLNRQDFMKVICKVLKEKDSVVDFVVSATDGKFEIVEAKVDNGK